MTDQEMKQERIDLAKNTCTMVESGGKPFGIRGCHVDDWDRDGRSFSTFLYFDFNCGMGINKEMCQPRSKDFTMRKATDSVRNAARDVGKESNYNIELSKIVIPKRVYRLDKLPLGYDGDTARFDINFYQLPEKATPFRAWMNRAKDHVHWWLGSMKQESTAFRPW